MAFASNHVSIAICAITAQHSLFPTSLSDVSLCLTVKILSHEQSYGRERRASMFHINDKLVGLGISCLPAGQHPRISCVERL